VAKIRTPKAQNNNKKEQLAVLLLISENATTACCLLSGIWMSMGYMGGESGNDNGQ
jgi:hypothetical protein